MKTFTTQDAFEHGFVAGQTLKRTMTIGEVENTFPKFTPDQVDTFINGMEDGMKNDRFRLDFKKNHPEDFPDWKPGICYPIKS